MCCGRVYRLAMLVSLLFGCLLATISSEEEVASRHDIEASKAEDAVGFEAVRQLHKQMDDDHSGSVDMDESMEFVREELNVKEKDRVQYRQQSFHHNNDIFITEDDLWERWMQSLERNWTVEDTIQWLVYDVDLPQYAESFERNAVDGRTLPRLSIQNTSFLASVLGVLNPVHRQKIQLKAMDAVLFGTKPPHAGYLKDFLLIVLLVLAVIVYAVGRYQRVKSQRELGDLSQHMEKLRGIEQEFQNVSNKLEEERNKHGMTSAAENEKKEALNSLRHQLEEAERRLESGVVGYAPLAMQPLLRKTCELEIAQMNSQKMRNMNDMKETMEMLEKLRRKQASPLNPLRLAVGTGTEADNLGQRIRDIKKNIEKTVAAMEESQHRWTQIESLCGFPILGSGVGSPAGLARVSSASASFTRPSSLNGITQLMQLPLALTTALAAVPNAYPCLPGMVRPALVTTPAMDEEELSRSRNPLAFRAHPNELLNSMKLTGSPVLGFGSSTALEGSDVSSLRHRPTPQFHLGDQGETMSDVGLRRVLTESGRMDSGESSGSGSSSKKSPVGTILPKIGGKATKDKL